MTMEHTIRTRLAAGATVRPDGRGVTLDLPGTPPGWFVQHVYDRAVTLRLAAEGIAGQGALPVPGSTRSEALTAFLALAEKRA
jgi:hypothetical protein